MFRTMQEKTQSLMTQRSPRVEVWRASAPITLIARSCPNLNGHTVSFAFTGATHTGLLGSARGQLKIVADLLAPEPVRRNTPHP